MIYLLMVLARSREIYEKDWPSKPYRAYLIMELSSPLCTSLKYHMVRVTKNTLHPCLNTWWYDILKYMGMKK